MSSHSGNAPEDTSMSCFNSSTSKNENRATSISTSNEGSGTGPYEVVYTEKSTEVDGSEETITLHYAFDDTNTTLFDEVTATESLLMLSEVRDNSKSQGGVGRSLSL